MTQQPFCLKASEMTSKPWLRLARTVLLALLGVGLAACSTLQFTYNQGPTLAYWWMDSYVDFDSVQASQAKSALEGWFDWHRSTELPRYVRQLNDVASLAPGQVSPQQVCAIWHQVKMHMLAGYEQAIPELARVLLTLQASQLTHMAQRYAKGDEEFEKDYVRPNPAGRLEKMRERWQDQLEGFYGELTAAQTGYLAQALGRLPFEPQVWLVERRLRHAEIVNRLRQLREEGAGTPEIENALRDFARLFMQSPRGNYRKYQVALEQAQCALVAQLHNDANISQRTALLQRIRRYQDDLHVLGQTKR